MDEKRQTQKELFEEFSDLDRKKHTKGIFSARPKRNITLSYEHLIFIVMALIIIITASFSLGVERGKHLAPRRLNQEIGQRLPVRATQAAQVTLPKQAQLEISTTAESLLPKEKVQAKAKAKEPQKPEGPPAVYTIQVASYFKKALAEKEVSYLAGKGFKAFLFPSDRYYIVCVGEFKAKDSSSSELKRLRKLYPDCYYIKIK